MGTLSTLTNPGFLVSIGSIFAVTVAALLFTQYLGRRRARRSGELVDVKEQVSTTKPGVTFADLAGMDEAIAEVREMGDYLADSHRYKRLGAELPTGILLYGPPGCGKTLLARALAGETGVPFYYISAASFVERYVGVGAARVRQLFETAREKPSILFIDELDAIGRHRHGDVGGGREFDNTLNQLLIELDGAVTSSRTLVMAATNRPEMIDTALLRPGRFDRRVLIDLPTPWARREILELHAARRRFSKRVDWGSVANDTAGRSAADLANLVNEAALLAARHHREMIGPEDVAEACSRLHAGTGAAQSMDDDERQLIAYHEAGHALLCLLLRGVRPPPRISIFSRGNATERSIWSIAEGRSVLTKRELQAQLILLLGGRAAEMNVFGEPTTRSEDDLAHAGALARGMVEKWAMIARPEAGTSLDTLARQVASGSVGASADPIGNLLNRAEQAARVILDDHAVDLDLIAEALAERETLTAMELETLVPGQSSQRVPAAPRRLQALPMVVGSTLS